MSSFLMRRATQAPRAIRAFSTTRSAQQMARIQLIGRLGDTPELMPTSNGSEYIRYNVATNSGTKENRQTSWWRVVCFMKEGAQRDFIAGLQKGSLVYIEGEPRQSTWTDSEGVQRPVVNIVQRHIEVVKSPFDPNRRSQTDSESEI